MVYILVCVPDLAMCVKINPRISQDSIFLVITEGEIAVVGRVFFVTSLVYSL